MKMFGEEIQNGMRRVSIPCPDGIVGCAVAHYTWIPVEPVEKKIEKPVLAGISFNDLHWHSDYNGYEVGYEDIPVVGFYQLKNTLIYFHINTENNEVLEYWSEENEE